MFVYVTLSPLYDFVILLHPLVQPLYIPEKTRYVEQAELVKSSVPVHIVQYVQTVTLYKLAHPSYIDKLYDTLYSRTNRLLHAILMYLSVDLLYTLARPMCICTFWNLAAL